MTPVPCQRCNAPMKVHRTLTAAGTVCRTRRCIDCKYKIVTIERAAFAVAARCSGEGERLEDETTRRECVGR